MNTISANSNNVSFSRLKEVSLKRMAKYEPCITVNEIINRFMSDKLFQSFCKKHDTKLTIDTFRNAKSSQTAYFCNFNIEYKNLKRGIIGKFKTLFSKPKLITFTNLSFTDDKCDAEKVALQNISKFTSLLAKINS